MITRVRSTSAVSTEIGQPNQPALVRVVDLGVGESRVVELCDGTRARVRLRGIDERRDTLKKALRATGANHEHDIAVASRFCIEVAKAFTGGSCRFYDEKLYDALVEKYGRMDRFQSVRGGE